MNSSVKIIILLLTLSILQFLSCSDNTMDPSTSTSAEYTQIDFEPAWSNTGDRIAYVHSDMDFDFNGIYIVNTNGTNSRLLINGFTYSPDWSPDGSWIFFSQNNNISKVRTTGDSLISLTDNGINLYPKCSSDGNWLVYSECGTQPCDVWIMKPDGKQKNMMVTNATYPNWVNGSSSFIYFSPIKDNKGRQTGDTLAQYFFSNGSKQVIALLNGDDHIINSYPVSAGDEIIFCSMNKDGYVYVYSMNLNGNNIAKLTTAQSYSPDYSSANQKIIYTNRNNGNGRLWIMDKNGSGQVQFTY
ncbi:MAG: hypothetical protein M3R36_12585 [Bacteroidota bacterium]|nr:hypothetical protein [Bacteroidota bacterium]